MFSRLAVEKLSRNVRTSLEKRIRGKGPFVDNVRGSCFPAARACSIFSPLIEPDTSITNVTSRGTARGRTDGGDSVIKAKPSVLPGALASIVIAALVERRIGIRS